MFDGVCNVNLKCVQDSCAVNHRISSLGAYSFLDFCMGAYSGGVLIHEGGLIRGVA